MTLIQIHLKPTGIIRRYVAEKDMKITVGLTIRGLITQLSIPPELKLMVFIDGQRKNADDILENGNEVRLITLLSGG
jgi:sulfur carrier protein ThiS